MSPCKRCYLLHVLTLRSKFKESNESIRDRIKLFKCVLPQVSDTLSPWFLYLKSSLSSSPRIFSPLFATSSHLLSYHSFLTPSPLLCRFAYVCYGTFLSFVLKMQRLPRNRYYGQAGPSRAMLDREVGRCPMEALHIISERRTPEAAPKAA